MRCAIWVDGSSLDDVRTVQLAGSHRWLTCYLGLKFSGAADCAT